MFLTTKQHRKEIAEMAKTIDELKEDCQSEQRAKENIKSTAENYKTQIARKDSKIAELKKEVTELENDCNEKEKRIFTLVEKEKESERVLMEGKGIIEEKKEKIDRIITILTHDIRKYAEIGAAELSDLMLNSKALPEEIYKSLISVRCSFDRTKFGIDYIAALASWLEESKIPRLKEPIILKDEIDKIFLEFKNIANYYNVALENTIDNDGVKKVIFDGDKFLIQVAFRNLIMNGLEANESNVRYGKRGHLEITSVKSDDGYHHILILNSGTSLSKENAKTIFSKEIESNKGADRMGEGTMLIKNISDLHKGQLQALKPQASKFDVSILWKIPKNKNK